MTSKVTIEVDTDRRLPTALLSRQLNDDQLEHLVFSLESSPGKSRLIGVDSRREQPVFEGISVSGQPVRYAVGYREKGGSSMRVMEVDLFSVEAGMKRRSMNDDDEGPKASYMEQRQTLIDTYAPAKKKRQVRLAQNAQVKDEKIHEFGDSMKELRSQMEAAVSNTPEGGTLAQMAAMLPTFNLTATNPHEVFDFSSVVQDSIIATLDPHDETSSVHSLLNWLKDGCPAVTSSNPLQSLLELRVVNRLAQTFLNKEHMKKKSFARLLLLVGSMLLLFIHRQDKNRTAQSLFISEDLKTTFDLIYGWGRLPQEGQDKLLCHICLFAARLTPDFSFPFLLLTEDIRGLAPKDLQPVLEFCGFKVTPGLAAVLNAPIKVPEIRKKASKR